MSSEFKQCPNGHYYQGSHCPYCKTSGSNAGSVTSAKTQVYDNLGNTQSSTETMPGMGGATKTTVVGGAVRGGDDNTVVSNSGGASLGSRTVFEPDDSMGGTSTNGGIRGVQGGYRSTRKLVGWLVSYTLDAMGVDYKLYEGRNIIGRDVNCNISVNDNMVSEKHTTLLFREGQYAIKDEMSTHGTFVNGSNIGFEPYLLQDGDEIKIGKTVFKFRKSF